MEILNETVYDSGDLVLFIEWVREHAHHAKCKTTLDYHRQHGAKSGQTYKQPVMRPMPEYLRVGYYNQTKPKNEKDRLPWTSVRGGGGKLRLGIVRHTKLPLVPMEVIALAAADKDQRVLPREVAGCLARQVCKILRYWDGNVFVLVEGKINEAPTIRYDHKANAKSAKAARAKAKAETLERTTEAVHYLAQEIRALEEKLVDRREKLARAKARLAKLKGKNKQEMTHAQG